VVVVAAVELPKTNPPVVVVVAAVARPIVPVQVAPVGQHAMFLAWSVVQKEPCVQHAPASAAAKVEHELKPVGQFPSLFSRSCSVGTRESLERRRESSRCGS